MRTLSDVIAYAHAHANDMDWEGDCEWFVHDAGGFTERFPSAFAAGSASGPLSIDPTTAQPGDIHYFAGANGYGHDAYELGGNLLLMASNAVTDDFGKHLGTCTFAHYQSVKNLPYRGHTSRHGTETLVHTTPAGGGVTPLEGETMPGPGFSVRGFETTHECLIMFDNGDLVYCVVEKNPDGTDLRRMEQIAAAEAGQPGGAYYGSDDDFNRALWIRGRYDLDWTTVKATVADNKEHVFVAPPRKNM